MFTHLDVYPGKSSDFVNIKSHLKLNFNDFIQLPSAFGKSNTYIAGFEKMRVNEYIKYFNYRTLTCYRQNQSFGSVRKKGVLKNFAKFTGKHLYIARLDSKGF